MANLGRLEESAAIAQRGILAGMSVGILGSIDDAAPAHVLMATVDRESLKAVSAAQAAAATAVAQAFALAASIEPEDDDETEEDLEEAAVRAPRPKRISRLQPTLTDIASDQLRAAYGDLTAKIKVLVRRVTLGEISSQSAERSLARLLKKQGYDKVFKAALTRAERIIRTEVNRSFSIASWEEMRETAATGISMGKYWLTARDSRVRHSHVVAGRRYNRAGAIPWKQAFIVGGERLMFPLDPRGSAEETANCRCITVSVVGFKRRRKPAPPKSKPPKRRRR